MKLDTSRPFGVVYGESSHRYEQDGKVFDGQGDEIVEQPPVEKVVVPRKTRPRKTPVEA